MTLGPGPQRGEAKQVLHTKSGASLFFSLPVRCIIVRVGQRHDTSLQLPRRRLLVSELEGARQERRMWKCKNTGFNWQDSDKGRPSPAPPPPPEDSVRRGKTERLEMWLFFPQISDQGQVMLTSYVCLASVAKQLCRKAVGSLQFQT